MRISSKVIAVIKSIRVNLIKGKLYSSFSFSIGLDATVKLKTDYNN